MIKKNQTFGGIDMESFKLGYYCEDDDYNLYGPYKSVKECEKYNYKNIWQLVKTSDKASRINKITLDFTSNTLTIEGGEKCNIKILDKELGNGVYSFVPDSWEVVLAKSKEACDDVVIIGSPDIKGECLDEMLHM